MRLLIPKDIRHNPGVYRIINMINNKMYIGSSNSMIIRYNYHLSQLRNNSHHSIHLQRSFNKRGEEAYVFENIRVFDKSIWELTDKEIRKMLIDEEQVWIDKYDASNPDKGYNMLPTAGSTLGMRHNKETKEFIRECSRNSWLTDIREKRLNAINALKRWVLIYTYPNGNFIGKYKGVKAAAEYLSNETGIPYSKWSMIYTICNQAERGKLEGQGHLSNHGFTFRWHNEVSEQKLWIDLAESEEIKLKRKSDAKNAQKFSVLKKKRWFLIYNRFTGNFIEEIFGIREIGIKYDIKHTSRIIHNVKGLTRYVGDYIFKVKESDIYPLNIDPLISRHRSNETRQKVIDVNMKKGYPILVFREGKFYKEYLNKHHVSRELNIDHWKINVRLNNGQDYRGYTFKYKDPHYIPRENGKRKFATSN